MVWRHQEKPDNLDEHSTRPLQVESITGGLCPAVYTNGLIDDDEDD